MPQRKEKNDKSGHQDAFLGLLNFLESPDPETVESVKNMIQENLCSSKDSRLLNNLVDFYIATQSKSSFEILLHVKDPHDKHLFEKVNEMMKNESTRYNALQLLGNIVYRQPTWLYKISGQRLMHTLLDILKTDLNSPNLLSGLFILICLLPMIPHLFGSLLRETFDIFSRLAAWNVKRPSSLSDILNLHLQAGIYSLFHRLYGMFPCNFLAYLRQYYGGRDSTGDNFKVFSLVIKPMLERVRLHPLLVTASKEAELNVNRWKRMAYHDIIVECASISLDTIEGTLENFSKIHLPSSAQSEKISSYESANSVSFHCQSSTSVFVEAINDTASSDQEHIWSPSQACVSAPVSYSSNLASPTISKGEWEFKNVMQSSTEESIPLDFAVEAKPELLKSDLEISEKFPPKDIDKEVSELTSEALEQSLTLNEIRHDTPFCSTTQNLTDEPANLVQTISLTSRSDSLTKSNDDDDVDEMYNSMQEPGLQSFAPTFGRCRYFSHCGPPPNMEPIVKQPKKFRSLSCPALICGEPINNPIELNNCDGKNVIEREALVTSSNVIAPTNSSAFVPLNGESSYIAKETLPVYQQLFPAVVNPLQGFEQPIIIRLPSDTAENRSVMSLSPPELLDHYIQQGSAAYLNRLPLTSGTDWTHFGDKPSDEIDVLRNQILLLHNMLLFERHRKDVHSERNRRILGRAKRTRMHEEYVDALKKEIIILTEENSNLKSELTNQYKMYQQLQIQKRQIKDELESKLFKSSQENTQLLYSNKQLQTLLVSQKEEIDGIEVLYKKAQCDVAAIKCQLKYASREMQQCQKVKKEAIFLTKQLILLQELNAQYKSKLEQMKEPQPDIKTKLMNDTMLAKIKELEQKLETKTILLDSSKGKTTELENILSNMKSKQKEKTSTYESMKSFHQAEIMAREERLNDLRKISVEKDAHILKLYADLERLTEKIESLGKKLCIENATNDKECSSSCLQPLNRTSCDRSIQRADEALS